MTIIYSDLDFDFCDTFFLKQNIILKLGNKSKFKLKQNIDIKMKN